MKKLLKYMKGYGKQCILGPLFKLLEATFELFIPLVVASIRAEPKKAPTQGVKLME